MRRFVCLTEKLWENSFTLTLSFLIPSLSRDEVRG